MFKIEFCTLQAGEQQQQQRKREEAEDAVATANPRGRRRNPGHAANGRVLRSFYNFIKFPNY